MTMLEDSGSVREPVSSPSPIQYRDRTTLLQVLGVYSFLLALGSFGLVGVMLLGTLAARAVPQSMAAGSASPASMIPSLLMYGVLGATYVVLGIGLFGGRKWARAIGHAVGWIWLVFGLFGLLVSMLVLPKVFEQVFAAAPAGSTAPPIGLMVGCTFVAMAVVFGLMPLPFVLGLGGRDVQRTVAAKDLKMRWTDGLGTPLLATVLSLTFGALSVLAIPISGVFPLFGHLFDGVTAFVFAVAGCALLASAAWFSARREILGWWLLLALSLVGLTNSAAMFLGRFDWNAYYERLGVSLRQTAFNPAELFGLTSVRISMIVTTIVYLGFIVWLKRYYDAPRSTQLGGGASSQDLNTPP